MNTFIWRDNQNARKSCALLTSRKASGVGYLQQRNRHLARRAVDGEALRHCRGSSTHHTPTRPAPKRGLSSAADSRSTTVMRPTDRNRFRKDAEARFPIKVDICVPTYGEPWPFAEMLE